MPEALALLTPALLICALVWALVGALLGLLYPAWRGSLRAMGAARRERWLLLISALPALIAALISLLLFIPTFGQPLISSHCHGQIGCAAHVPAGLDLTLTRILVLPALLLLGGLIWRALALVAQHRWRLRQLLQLSVTPSAGPYALLDCSPPLALTAGLWRPRIFVSRGLVESLDSAQLQSVLAHEMAHLRRRDNLRLALAQFLAPGWLSGAGRPLSVDLRTAAEQCCDAAAAQDLGDPLLVAEALIRAQRALPAPTQGQSASPTAERIARLVQEPVQRPLQGSLALLSLLLTATLLATLGVNLLHHGTESVLGWIRP